MCAVMYSPMPPLSLSPFFFPGLACGIEVTSWRSEANQCLSLPLTLSGADWRQWKTRNVSHSVVFWNEWLWPKLSLSAWLVRRAFEHISFTPPTTQASSFGADQSNVHLIRSLHTQQIPSGQLSRRELPTVPSQQPNSTYFLSTVWSNS